MHKIQSRLRDIMGSGKHAWAEPEATKKVITGNAPSLLSTSNTNYMTQFTIAHNMTEMTSDSNYWDPELLSQSLLGIWFAAAHQPWMFLDFILLELCARPELQRAIQAELDDFSPSTYQELEKLPLLDSFIKETVRLNPLDNCTYHTTPSRNRHSSLETCKDPI